MSRVAATPLTGLCVHPVAKKRFNDHPFPYHAELELEISKLTNLGVGLGRVMLPIADFGLPIADCAIGRDNARSSAGTVSVPQSKSENQKSETPAPASGGAGTSSAGGGATTSAGSSG